MMDAWGLGLHITMPCPIKHNMGGEPLKKANMTEALLDPEDSDLTGE